MAGRGTPAMKASKEERLVVVIVKPDTPALVADATALVSEYVEYLASLFEEPTIRARFADEVGDLARYYAPPGGRILLALADGEAVGCAMLRDIDASGACEVRRLYVREPWRRRGIAAALMRELTDEAREAGCGRMRLVTNVSFDGALSLYERLGFERVAPYRQTAMSGMTFMELRL